MNKINSTPHMMIMAGGTGGHIYPALAVAALWQQQGGSVVWLGNPKGMEARLVPEAGFDLEPVRIDGLRGKGITSLLAAPMRLLRALWQSLQAIRRQQPDVVLGMGGFVSGPGGLAAWLLRKPLVVHEQNAIAGLTNKLLARFSSEVLQAFPGALDGATTIGNPVRSELYQVAPATAHQPLRLLVLGGSLGAQRINQLVPELLAELQGVEVYHQTGARNLDETLAYYRAENITPDDSKVRVVPYIDEMEPAYAWADLVLCRAGAMTISELALVGRGSILVPFPFAVDDHQSANGRFLQQAGAAMLVQQHELDREKLLQWITEWREQPQRIAEMGAAAKALAQPEATQRVVEICRKQGGK
ncbi:MAG: undecaprenyldiphospho-muramoylpentapeptide beta-N-acetylglucosaminyltransferase [Gammaproteobacteria bacterium]|jgi:UDP-N-acetylglucosamine--N-acetylmuramyl-(pentapeptide) pyrophosphoryl-undecaprenol N-acetylglucosamine transferase|nr:undecaprenyldiphospho-muramoylpentapeptide beta-N-acetylglucosaminyltransferase [Gammaproteobacteria bacterium]